MPKVRIVAAARLLESTTTVSHVQIRQSTISFRYYGFLASIQMAGRSWKARVGKASDQFGIGDLGHILAWVDAQVFK